VTPLAALARRLLTVARSRSVRVVFVAVAATLAVWALAARWGLITAALDRLDTGYLLPAVVATAANQVLTGMAWRALLTDLGSRLPLPVAARVFFVGQIGKYVPGSVWPVVVQAELARDHGVPRRRTAAATAVMILLSTATGLAVVLAALPFMPAASGGQVGRDYLWALALIVPLLVVLHPRVLGPLLDRLLAAIGTEPLEHPPTLRGSALATAWAVAAWLAAGAQVWLLAVALGAPADARTFALATGGYALAWAVGLVVVFAPAGAGAREVALIAVLAPVLDGGGVLVVVLASRVLFTLADLIAAAAGYGVGRRHVRPR
jgi:uncharacterized membrane protein YbhN (UPF0104 family)